MAFTKIENSDFNDKGALSMSDRPSETKSAHQIKALFDAPAKEVIAPKFNNLIDELEAETASASIGAVSATGTQTTVQAMLNQINDKGDMKTEEYDPSYRVLNVGGIPAYVSSAIINKVDVSDLANVAFSGKYEDLNNIPEFATVAYSGQYSDLDGAKYYLSDFLDDGDHRLVTDAEKAGWDAKADTSDIPTSLSELSDDSTHRVVTDTEKTTWNGKSVVSVTQVQTTGDKIATITVDGNGTDIYAPEGGAGSGDMKKSDYDADQAVKLAGGIKAYVSSQISSAMVGVMEVSDYDPNSAVANAGGIDRYVSSQISTAITSALTASY